MYRTLLARVAQRKCWLIDNYFKEYKHLKTAEPHVASNVRYIAFAMRTNSPNTRCWQGAALGFPHSTKKAVSLVEKLLIRLRRIVYSKWDLNPHSHHWPKDFKSFVSTDSTIRAT